MSVEENSEKNRLDAFKKIITRIDQAAKKAGRNSEDIELVVVSKTFGIEDILPILRSGYRVFGENRVQEAKKKWSLLNQDFSNNTLHFIGSLQSNKIAEVVKLFDVIQTVDREKIAAILAQETKKQNKFPKIYVQVNIGVEPQKAGIIPQEVFSFVKLCQSEYQLNIVGLMCIPPVNKNPVPYFALLEKIRREMRLKNLSMGMSGDFEKAIAFGATCVRIGSAIFGNRSCELFGS